MLVECGFVRAVASDGAEFTFRPALSRIASLGTPQEIVSLYAGLHGPRAAQDAAYVLACLCDQDDVTPLVGGVDDGDLPREMTIGQRIIIARRLMHHGIIGKANPSKGDGKYSDSFNAHEYIAAACVHLGLSRADAESLSMTEFHTMFEMKFPDSKAREVPSRDAYTAFMDKLTKA